MPLCILATVEGQHTGRHDLERQTSCGLRLLERWHLRDQLKQMILLRDGDGLKDEVCAEQLG